MTVVLIDRYIFDSHVQNSELIQYLKVLCIDSRRISLCYVAYRFKLRLHPTAGRARIFFRLGHYIKEHKRLHINTPGITMGSSRKIHM